MVSGVFCLPTSTPGTTLAGLSKERHRSPPPLLSEFLAADENRLVPFALDAVFAVPLRISPVVFYGASGVGKSMLLHATAARWRNERPNSQVLLTTGSDFARDYANAVDANAVDANSIVDFRERHLQTDLLVIDDLQQIAQKHAAQMELIGLWDAMAEKGCPIIATLPKPPAELSLLMPMLVSRLCNGLVCQLVPPTGPARRLVIERLVERYELPLASEAVTWLVNNNSPLHDRLQTIPQLNAAMTRLQLLADERPLAAIDLPFLLDTLVEAKADDQETVHSIMRLVAKYFDVKTGELKGTTRQQRVVRARGVAMLLTRRLTNHSLQQVGRHFGDRDHTTVMHACRKTESLIESDPRIRQAVDELSRNIHLAP